MSQQLVGSLACPQQELLSEAGPGLAGGCVRLTATLGDASLGLCLSAGWETAFSLCSALWVLRSKTLYFCATRHELIPSSFVKRLEKEIWIKELLLLAAARPQGFPYDYSKGNLHFLLRLQGEQQFDATLCPLCSSSGLPFSVFLSIHSVFSYSMLNLPSIPTASCR